MAALMLLVCISLLFHGAHFTYWKNVSTCPTDSKTWKIKTDSLCKGNTSFHCIVSMDDIIVETCAYSHTVKGRDGCPQVALYKGKVFFTPDHTDCPLWNKECPQVNATYATAELYKYRACLRKLDDRNESSAMDQGTSKGKVDEGILYIYIFIPIAILVFVFLALAILYLKRKAAKKMLTKNTEESMQMQTSTEDHVQELDQPKQEIITNDTEESIQMQPPTETDHDELQRLKKEKNIDSIRSKLNEWRTLPVHIAIIGPSCVGKSTFINKVRGVPNKDKSAAKVGQGNCTDTVISYCHPANDKVVFWDVPGYGTDKYSSGKEYLKLVNIERFDFVLLFFYPTIHATDTVWMIKQLKSKKKDFFLVRAKIDTEMSCVEEHGKSLNDMIDDIKATCTEKLRTYHISDVKIFAISNIKQEIGEFNLLLKHILMDMSSTKRESLLYTLGCLTEEMIEDKIAMLKNRAWRAALTMSSATAIPVPGVDHAVCVAALISEIEVYLDTFNLNANDIGHLPQSTLIRMDTANKMLKLGVNEYVLTWGIKFAAIAVVDQNSTFAIPVIGFAVSGVVSYPFHVSILRGIIDALAYDALIVCRLQREQLE